MTEQTKPNVAKEDSAKDVNKNKNQKVKINTTQLLCMVIAIAALVLAIYVFTEQKSFFGTTDSYIRSLNNTLTENTKLLSDMQDSLSLAKEEVAVAIDSLKEDNTNLKNKINAMKSDREMLQEKQVITESLGLLKTAELYLSLAKDKATAIVLLSAIDKKLDKELDPQITAIRKEVNKVLNDLNMMPNIDIIKTWLALDDMNRLVEELNVSNDIRAQLKNADEDSGSSNDAKGAISNLKQGIKKIGSLVVIRNHAKPIKPLLPPEQEIFLKQNISMKLQSAKIALLKADRLLYKKSLNDAISWLDDNFADNNSNARKISQELTKLQEIDINPEFPTLVLIIQKLEAAL